MAMTEPTVVYLDPQEVMTLLGEIPCITAVVDVRGNDREGGHIPNSLNIPAEEFFGERLEALSAYLCSNKFRNVVFHCQYSKKRGPRAAEIFLHGPALMANPPVRVFVLRGGFAAWVRQFRDIPTAIADFERDKWALLDEQSEKN